MSDKNIIKFVIIIFCFLAGIYFLKVFQTPEYTNKIYKEALRDFQNGNYSNSYYLFSKVGVLSKLKPTALYRQALCAKALGDEHSQLRAYQTLLRHYPASRLSIEARYEAGQILVDSDPRLAKRYFHSVRNSDNENYRIASEYYIAKIDSINLRYSNKGVSQTKKNQIENAFRTYLQKYSDGRLAAAVANSWIKFNPDLSSKDYNLVAKAYYFTKFYDQAKEVLAKTELSDSWTTQALNSYSTNDKAKADNLVESGVSKYANAVETEDYKLAVDAYLEDKNDKYAAASKLFSIANGKGKDYIWNVKCANSPKESETACYTELYNNYQNSDYAQDALANIFFSTVENRQYSSAKQVGLTYLEKFPDGDYAPMVMFWEGKIYDSKYYQDVINKFPDSYYAYRAYWILKGVSAAVIRSDLELKPVIYPYKFPAKGSMIYSLIKVGDYDMIPKFTKDEFVKSWVEYQKGNYSVSVHTAQKAMEQLKDKPVKNDLRWRLIYPQNYYKQVLANAPKYKNDDALIMAIIKEESYFNMYAQSSVGAMGLMQLMPATAREIGEKNGLNFNTTGLFNPELNIKIGNIYYSSLRNMLQNNDVLSVAAYNGGVGSVTKWKDSISYSDIDEFVEQIPYSETKNYVKKVLRSYWNYVRIYQK
ncbi:transglycosylase SLT domain-containing protein [bacterium]|nr:transglycosylase SLT domain-containing protein [bacterium]